MNDTEKLAKLEALLVKWVQASDAFDAVPTADTEGAWLPACQAWEAASNELMQAGRERMKEIT
jgi:hypothetical protein